MSGASIRFLSAAALVLLLVSPGVRAEPPPLQTDSARPNAGYYVLDWGKSEVGTFELRERSAAGDERILYRGADTARLISGRSDGEYRYQVRRIGEAAWSEPVVVEVEHHPLGRALGFFLVGALVFVSTIVLVVRGASDDDNHQN